MTWGTNAGCLNIRACGGPPHSSYHILRVLIGHAIVKENAEALVVATKEIGLEVNADKTKYMVMSRNRNAGQGHSVKIDNTSIERVEEF